jgi:hypothetical protein
MTYDNLEQIFDEIDGTRGRLVARYGSLSEPERTYRASENAWSAEQIIEHLAITEIGMVRLINKLLGRAEEAGVPAAADGSIPPFTMDEFIRATGIKLEAPDRVQPTGAMNGDQAMASLKATRGEIRALRPRLAAVDLSGATFSHPFAGPLNLYQWLAFIGLHEQRHLDQMERTVADRS